MFQRLFETPRNALTAVIGSALTVHLVLLLYDIAHPQLFMTADRAALRLGNAQGLIASAGSWASFSEFFATHGQFGDYAFHAIPLALGGPYLVICAQIALALLSFAAFFRLCMLLTNSIRLSAWTTLAYILTPHCLIFPHVLASEAIFNPLVVLFFYTTVECLVSRASPGKFLYSGLVTAFAMLVRPVAILVPFGFATGFAVARKSAFAILMYLLGFAVPLGLWVADVSMATGKASLGSSVQDANHNMYRRVVMISNQMPPAQRAEIERIYLNGAEADANGSMLGLSTYLSFVVAHPAPVLHHALFDGVSFFLKSDVERVTVDYLGLMGDQRSKVQDAFGGWRSQFEKDGLAAVRDYWLRFPVVITTSAFGVFAMLAVWTSFAIGCVQLWRTRGLGLERGLAWLALVLFPFYIFAISQLVDMVFARHRAPAEFAILAVAAVGVQCILRSSAKKVRASETALENAA